MPYIKDEQLKAWRQRWNKNIHWIDEIISCLQGDPPQKSAQRICQLPWYKQENGFSPLTFSPDHRTVILDLRGISLSHTDLHEISIPFALLDGADLYRADLQDADLSFCRMSHVNCHQANFSNAKLTAVCLDHADLSMATLSNANLERASLVEADLGWADVSEGRFVQANFYNAKMERIKAEKADFTNADMRSANLSMALCQNTIFEAVDARGLICIAASLEESTFTASNLDQADLSLSQFNGTYLNRASMKKADLTKASFRDTDLSGSNLAHANLYATQFTNARLYHTSLYKANLYEANLYEADLRHADLTASNLNGTILLSSRLDDADLREADLLDCRLRSPKESAQVNNGTRFGWTSQRKFGIFNWMSKAKWLTPPLSALSRQKKQLIKIEQVRDTYSQVRMLFRDNGLFHRSAEYYFQDNYWRTRAERFRGNYGRFLLRWIFLEKLTGYGEKPLRIAITSLLSILFFAVLFLFAGIHTADKLINYDLQTFWGQDLYSDLRLCFLYSIQCFVTAGLGMVKPASSLSHLFASVEGIFGIAMMILGVLCFGNKTIRD